MRQETPVSFNRRFVMRDGSVRTWMNLANPEVVRPAGPIDPEVGVMGAWDLEGRLLGTVVDLPKKRFVRFLPK